MNALRERGHDVTDGTKVYGVNQYGPRKYTFHNNGGVVVEGQKSTISTAGGSTSHTFSISTAPRQPGYKDTSDRSFHRDKHSREQSLVQIIHELDEWVQEGSPGSRSAYLHRVKETKVCCSPILMMLSDDAVHNHEANRSVWILSPILLQTKQA